jgi:periplasmic protein TonB
MLPSTSLHLGSLALGLSVALHGAVLLASTAPSTPSPVGLDPTVDVEVLTLLASTPETESEATPRPVADPVTLRVRTPLEARLPPHDSTPREPRPASSVVRSTAAPTEAAPSPVDGASTADPPSFKISIGGDARGKAPSPGVAAAQEDDRAPVPERSVDGAARLVAGPSPAYPDDARAAGIEGDVHLELVVDAAGTVTSARVLHGVGRGLDESAMRAVRQFQFAPATKAGRPVSVRMGWSIRFRLQ